MATDLSKRQNIEKQFSLKTMYKTSIKSIGQKPPKTQFSLSMRVKKKLPSQTTKRVEKQAQMIPPCPSSITKPKRCL